MSTIREIIADCQQALADCVQAFVEPHANIADPEDRYRSRLLNSLIVVYLPLALLVILIRAVTTPGDMTSTLAITSVGIAVVFLIYLLGRIGHYGLSVYVTVALGFGVIYLNAMNSDPPHLEIVYLLFLPLIGIVLFSYRQAVVIYLIAMLLLILFLVTTGDVETNTKIDLFVFLLLAQGFILFASYQRNRLEANRRDLRFERERRKLVTELIGNVSHDFKTPLTLIQNSTYFIRKVNTPERLDQELTRIDAQTERLRDLIDAMLTLSQIEQEALSPVAIVNVSHLIRDVVEQLDMLAQAKQIVVEVQQPVAPCEIAGSYAELERMSMNLVENALLYTPNGGAVTHPTASSCPPTGPP